MQNSLWVFAVLLSLPRLLFATAHGFEAASCDYQFSKVLEKPVKYCIHRTQPKRPMTSEAVVYFFHGMRGSSESWFEGGYAKALESLKAKRLLPAATFVSFDTGSLSFFADFGGQNSGEGAYETWLQEEFIPWFEEKYGVCHERNCRATLGYSMGGFGAIKTALKHPEKFISAAGNCPALAPFNIFDSSYLWNAYFLRHPIGPFEGNLLLSQVKKIFPTREIFNADDPAILVSKIPDKLIPRLYFDVGSLDHYGFQEGQTRLAKELSALGYPYTADFVPGIGHEIYLQRNRNAIQFVLQSFLDSSLKSRTTH